MTETLVKTWKPNPQPDHVMQTYDGEFPANEIAAFLRKGRDAGEAVVVVARPAHRKLLEGLLGNPPGSPRAFFLDADRSMERFFIHGAPDEHRFHDTVGAVLNEAARQGNGRVRAYGEMVALLCERGEHEAALQLERLWNRVAEKRPLSLLCAYQRGSLADGYAPRLHAEHC